MTRGGRLKSRSEPERRCIVTGESQPVGGLIRFVVGPEQQIVPDILARLPGRGIWVSANRDALATAIGRNLFSRWARQAVQVPDELADRVEDQLVHRVTSGLSLARKAGQAVCGYEKVKSWLDREEASVLIQAMDGSSRGKSKLSTPYKGTYIGWLRSKELGLAFGRDHVIHCAVAPGGLSHRVVEDASRLKGLRAQDGGVSAGKGTKTE